MSSPGEAARERIDALGLQPHPEGGYYREFFRSASRVRPGDGREERHALSVIHFLLSAGDRSRWHAIRSDELWTFLDGEPVELLIVHPDSMRLETRRLGGGDPAAERSVVVPGGAWQAARPLGAFGLVSCAVAPAFEFEDFRFLADDESAAHKLASSFPDLRDLL